MDDIFRIAHEYSSKQQIGGGLLSRRKDSDPNTMPEFSLLLFKWTNVGEKAIKQWIKNTTTGIQQVARIRTAARVEVQQSPDVTESSQSTSDRSLKNKLDTVKSSVSSAVGRGAHGTVSALESGVRSAGNLAASAMEKTRNAYDEHGVDIPLDTDNSIHEFENPLENIEEDFSRLLQSGVNKDDCSETAEEIRFALKNVEKIKKINGLNNRKLNTDDLPALYKIDNVYKVVIEYIDEIIPEAQNCLNPDVKMSAIGEFDRHAISAVQYWKKKREEIIGYKQDISETIAALKSGE